MAQLSSKSNKGVHIHGEATMIISKKSSGSSTTGETQLTCSTRQSRSRTPSPQQQLSRGMDPGGLIVIPRRQHPTINAKSSKPDTVVVSSADVATGDKGDKLKEQQGGTLVASSLKVVTPPATVSFNNSAASPKVEETALTLYDEGKAGKTNSKSTIVSEKKPSDGRQYRAHLWNNTPKANKRPSFKSRPLVTNSRDNHAEDDNNHRGKKDRSKVVQESFRGNSKGRDDAGADRKKKKDSDAKDKPTDGKEGISSDKPATKRNLIKRKSTKLKSISGSRKAIRSFSESKGMTSNRQGDGEDGKKQPGKNKSFIKRLGSKFSEKTAAAVTYEEKNEVVVSKETSPNNNAAPTAKNQFSPPRGKGMGKRESDQKVSSKQDLRSYSPSPSPASLRRRPSSSLERGNSIERSMSPQSHSSRDSYYSRYRSPSPSPRRSRRSLSPQSSRASFYSRSRSHSSRWRRSLSPHSCSSYSRSRSPSPHRRRSLSSQSSYGSTVNSFYSRSRSPPRRRSVTRSISPPSRGYRGRVKRFSRSRTPSPPRMTGFAGDRYRRRSPRRVSYNRRDSFRSLSPPLQRSFNDDFPMRRQSSFSSRNRSPQFCRGRRQIGAHLNHRPDRGNPGPNRRNQRRMSSPPRGRRGSNSPPMNRSFSRQERFGRDNNGSFQRTYKAPIESARRRPPRQRRGSVESRRTRSLSPLSTRPQCEQPYISHGNKRHVSRGSAPTHAVESQALVVRDASPSTDSIVSTSSLAPEVKSKSAPRRLSSESTGVWIDCPEQFDPCDEDLSFSECQDLRDNTSDATCDAKHAVSRLGPSSVAHSFATYSEQDGPPSRQGSKQVRSRAANLMLMAEYAENSIQSVESRQTTHVPALEDYEVAKTKQQNFGGRVGEQGLTRKLTTGSSLSCDPPFVPGPPPRKPLKSFASVPKTPRPKSPALVRNGTSFGENSGAGIESGGPANHNDLAHNIHSSPPPPPFPRSNITHIELKQPVAPNSGQDLLEYPTDNTWQQYLTRGKRNTSRGRSNSPARDTSRGRKAFSSGSKERSSGERSRSLSAGRKLFSRAPEKLDNNDRQVLNLVSNMPFRDPFGDFGVYTGQVNEDGRPDGKGSMKYDNGIFYEGMWTDGCQDEKAATQYDRIRGGFTSWGGKGKAAVKSGMTMPWNATKNDKNDDNVTTNVRGMEWVDMNGDSGRYTGEVNNLNIPHGMGIMRYSFGLIAEGEWVLGVLKENPHDRMLSAADLSSRGQNADAMSILSSARSLGLGGGMSVGPGMSASISAGGMRPMLVGGGMSVAQGSVYNGMPQMPQMMMMQPQQVMSMQMQPQPQAFPMMMPPTNTMTFQQNAALNSQQIAIRQAGPMIGCPPMGMQPPPPQGMISLQDKMGDKPPITEIKFS